MKWLKDLIMESESWLPLILVLAAPVIMCCVGGLVAAVIWGSDAFLVRWRMPLTPEQCDRVTTGYQNTTTGRRCAPVAHWSDSAMRYALGIDEWMRSPTAAQRRIGITSIDQYGRAVYGG